MLRPFEGLLRVPERITSGDELFQRHVGKIPHHGHAVAEPSAPGTQDRLFMDDDRRQVDVPLKRNRRFQHNRSPGSAKGHGPGDSLTGAGRVHNDIRAGFDLLFMQYGFDVAPPGKVQFFRVMPGDRHIGGRGGQSPSAQDSQSAVPQDDNSFRSAQGKLFQDFTGRGQRFREDGPFIGYRLRHLKEICRGQHAEIRHAAVKTIDAEGGPFRAVPAQSPIAPGTVAACGIDFTDNFSADQGRVIASIHDADEFVPHDPRKPHVPFHDLKIGPTNSRQADLDSRPARFCLRQRIIRSITQFLIEYDCSHDLHPHLLSQDERNALAFFLSSRK